jgi:hypothetical protein
VWQWRKRVTKRRVRGGPNCVRDLPGSLIEKERAKVGEDFVAAPVAAAPVAAAPVALGLGDAPGPAGRSGHPDVSAPRRDVDLNSCCDCP